MSRRVRVSSITVVAGLSLLAGIAAARSDSNPGPPARAAAKPVRLADATMIVEVNATDGDAGVQVFLDGEGWRTMAVVDPRGRRVLDVTAEGRMARFGLTELFSESSEPTFEQFPLRRFKQLFPEGRYAFAGTTVDGRRLVGSARLSHAIPDGPQIVAPSNGATVARGALVADWDPVTTPRGIRVAGYRAIVTREDPLRIFSADLLPSATRVTVPAEFLEPGTEYKLEVQAIEASGNQTLTEVTFRVG